MALADKIKKGSAAARYARQAGPVWKGPEKDGITFSLLSRFLTCRERFRVLVVDGLKPEERWNHHIEFGQMWHSCEEALAGLKDWRAALMNYVQLLVIKYPMDREQIAHWADVCRVQFPEYVDYWSKHPDVKDRAPLLQEQSFDVPYKLPSGRVVRLRGKWDSVDLIGKGKAAGVYLQENKTKGRIDQAQLQRQLTFDLQTMMYIVALGWYNEHDDQGNGLSSPQHRLKAPIKGVRYNVIRRDCPIRQHKPSKSNPQGEGRTEFYQRLVNDYIREAPGEWFMRWKTEITEGDVAKFRHECLDPILMQLCDWWEGIVECKEGGYNPFGVSNPISDKHGWHYRHPFGVRNIMDEGGSSDLDEYLMTGSTLGLRRVDNLFPELT